MEELKKNRSLLLTLTLCLFALGACVGKDSYTFLGTEYKPAEAAGALDLTDQNGDAFNLDMIRGDVAVIYFGYTTCPDICPTTLSDFMSVKELLGDDADNVEFIMVTVDPERDTSEVLKQYLAFFDPEFIGLRGDQAATTAVENEYGVTALMVDQPDSATGYLVNHTSRVFVIDPDGNLRLTYSYGTAPEDIAEDIKHLL